jgi:hypothetical protein
MKSTPENISRQIVLTYARAVREIQTKQIDPYLDLIAKEILNIFPDLEGEEDGAENWACDVANASSNEEVVQTLNRLGDIVKQRKYARIWSCRYCGKDTSNVEYDYLSGTDHLGCVLEHSQFDNDLQSKSDPDGVIEYIKQLEERIAKLEGN